MSDTVSTDLPAAPRGLKTAGVVMVLAALGVVAIGTMTRAQDTSDAQHVSDAGSIPTVHLVTVKANAASDPLTLPGTMAAWNAANIYARVPGYLKAWYRDIGAVVPAGAPLGQVDTPELDQQILQARAGLASARAAAGLAADTAARWNDLLTTNSVSRQETAEKNGDLVVKRAAVQSAQADLGRLLAQKALATIRAPFGGVVTTRSADIGDLVGPGASAQQPLFAIADDHRIRAYVSVPQSSSAAIKAGVGATLTIPEYPGRTFLASVVGDAGAIDARSGTLKVQLVANNPGGVLRPGGYAQVRFDVPGGGGVQLPSSALIFRAAGTEVALVGPGARVKLRRVTLGRDLGATVEVLSGLPGGTAVIDNPPDSIADGELVRVAASRNG